IFMYGRARDEMTRSKASLSNGSSSPAPCRYVRCGNFSLATARRLSSMSSPVTSSDAATPQGIKSRPDPQPRSRTRISSCLQTNHGSHGGPRERNSTVIEKLGEANSCAQVTAITDRKQNQAIRTECLRNTTRAASRVLALMINCLRNRNGCEGCCPKGPCFSGTPCIRSWSDFVYRASPPTNPIIRSVFPLVVFFLAAIFSGILEKMPFLSHLHILTILGGLALIVVGLSGRLPVVLNDPIAKCLAMFTVWFIVCTPFGEWIGGSVALFLNYWSKAALSFVLVA